MQVRTITHVHPTGEIQRYQIVEDFKLDNLRFISPGFDKKAVEEIARLYRINIVPKQSAAFGVLVFFHVPASIALPVVDKDDKTTYFSHNVAASVQLNSLVKQKTIRWEENKLTSTNAFVQTFLSTLKAQGLLTWVQGTGNGIWFIPLSAKMGFLSKQEGSLLVNSHFFLMDPTDLDSPYCELGTPHGLALKDSVVLNPPLNHRPCLLFDAAQKSSIQTIELTDLTVEIDGITYRHQDNADFYLRPESRITPPSKGTDIIITETQVVATKDGGETRIPMAGFVISVPNKIRIYNPKVIIHGLEAFSFGIQVGPPMMEDYQIVDTLCCPFYNAGSDAVPYPSTVYPLPFETARAARIALGTNRDSKPVLIWAEGAGKLSYTPTQDSTGASLLELARFCEQQGFENIINLDGGGSAQILVDHHRVLKIADRYPTNEEAERPVPYALSLA